MPSNFTLPGAFMTPAQMAAQGRNDGKGTLDRVSGWWNKRPDAPQMAQDPYQSNWGNLISQLELQASGQGPSLAGEAYKQANQTGVNNALSMSRGGSAGSARAGMRQMGQMNQGLAQGYANARLAEQLAARQQLAGAIGGASQSWYNPNAANLQAQMGMMNQPTNGQKLLGTVGQLAAIGGMIFGGPAGAAAMSPIAAGYPGAGGYFTPKR